MMRLVAVIMAAVAARTYSAIAGYGPASNMTEHAKIDLDAQAIDTATIDTATGSSDWEEATDAYENGRRRSRRRGEEEEEEEEERVTRRVGGGRCRGRALVRRRGGGCVGGGAQRQRGGGGGGGGGLAEVGGLLGAVGVVPLSGRP